MTRRRIPFASTAIAVLADDRYQAPGASSRNGKPGARPSCSDSAAITLMARMDVVPSLAETPFIERIRSHESALFPRLLTQRQGNRRSRDVRLLVDMVRRSLLDGLGTLRALVILLDAKPIPVVGAACGVCADRNRNSFGSSPVGWSPLDGRTVVCDLASANRDERESAESVLFALSHGRAFADTGFSGADRQADIAAAHGTRIFPLPQASHPT